jgi:hypothetical protein
MNTVKWLARFILVIFLTILTQIGGLSYLLSSLISRKILSLKKSWQRACIHFAVYMVLTFLIIPALSPRKALPLSNSDGLRPLSFITCVLNRHYVDPELHDVMSTVNEQFDYDIAYLDANFPFVDGFPLLPHLSHNDGQKLDLAFQYGVDGTDLESAESLTFIGYGSFEEPMGNEANTVQRCEQQGGWYYSLTSIFPKWETEATFHQQRTKALVELVAKQSAVSKIFIEPHLKQRLNLSSSKVKFHGCHAVRHDDHIHLQIR